MNKAAIKNFAIWARTKLIEDIKYKAGMIGISATGIAQPLPQSTRDLQFFDIGTKDYAQVAGREIAQRDKLILAIREKERTSDYQTAFRYVIEEVAYTWFNRLIAVRFMEVNDYLPSRVRVLSSENPNKTEPDFVTNPFDTDLSFTSEEQDLVLRLKDENRLDELFGMLFIKQCNKLHEILPNLFEETADYTELLLTLSFTDKDGVVYHLVHDIPEDDFNVSVGGQVEIIGWLYQYYNTEPKDEVFADLKKNIKISKEKIPAATQLFTPDWIVRYMVENSLGRLWTEGHPNDELKSNWKYYLGEAEQEPQVQAQLAEIRKEYAALTPEDIKLIDPCMGSGHILVYAFDVLMQIYVANGYLERDAAQSILQNNLYGLDIDDRAAQLAYFAVMMKARQYDRRIFSREITPHVFALQDSPVKGQEFYALLQNKPAAKRLMQSFHEAKEYGSIIEPDVTLEELDALTAELDALEERLDRVDFVEEAEIKTLLTVLRPMIEQGHVLKQKYDVVITNPPYMGASGMGARLSQYVKDNYPDSKSDMSTVCMEKTLDMCKPMGYMAMINIPVWMFLSSYEKLRYKLLSNNTYINMTHPGRGIFGSDFGTTSFVISKQHMTGYKGSYRRLFQKQGEVESIEAREQAFLNGVGCFTAQQDNFSKIPGAPVAYWVGDKFLDAFLDGTSFMSFGEPKSGVMTGDDNKFVRFWFEVMHQKIGFRLKDAAEMLKSAKKWFPVTRGGAYRKWYGNLEEIVNLENDGHAIKHNGKNYRLRDKKYYMQPGITWTMITSYKLSVRIAEQGILFGNGGPTSFAGENNIYLLSLLNSKVSEAITSVLNPTINTVISDICAIPVLFANKEEISNKTDACITLSRTDWDSFETSWDFQLHPLIRGASVADAYSVWEQECNTRFAQLKAKEEELNRIFIDIYGLQDELTPEVEDKDVTVRRADLSRDIRSLISYAVGCMFGRYSLDVPGLVLAGQKFESRFVSNPSGLSEDIPATLSGNYIRCADDSTDIKVCSFMPDRDNCIPITDEEYFEDDIVGRFVDFIRTVYGAETLEENLDFIAKALGNKGDTSRQVIRNYFLNDFMKDHMKIYQKRPIYWQFDSGKQNGFKALVYMHRWNADTVGNLRVEYLHRMQRVYEKEMERMQETIDNSGNSREVAAARKRKEKLTKQLKEAKDFDAKIAHIALSRIDIDLDDGVKVNYEKVQKGADGKSLGILTKI